MTKEEREAFVRQVITVLVNNSNLPDWMQISALGRDMRSLAELVVEALFGEGVSSGNWSELDEIDLATGKPLTDMQIAARYRATVPYLRRILTESNIEVERLSMTQSRGEPMTDPTGTEPTAPAEAQVRAVYERHKVRHDKDPVTLGPANYCDSLDHPSQTRWPCGTIRAMEAAAPSAQPERRLGAGLPAGLPHSSCPTCHTTWDRDGRLFSDQGPPAEGPRDALLAAIEARRSDSEFMARIKASIEKHKPILDWLAEDDGPAQPERRLLPHATWGDDPSGYCGCAGCNADEDAAQPGQGDGLRARVEAAAETIRLTMLDQPTTDTRDTYSDGFGQGCAYALDRIRPALAAQPDPAPLPHFTLREADLDFAPAWYGYDEASAWVNGWNAARDAVIAHLRGEQ